MPACLVAVAPPTFPIHAAWNWRAVWDRRTTSWRTNPADREGLARMPWAREREGPNEQQSNGS
eukprot:11207164-Lingulodinium_polyedra.AAC.1